MGDESNRAANVYGDAITTCSTAPMTGFFRDGCCNTGGEDLGLHLVCVQVDANFLEYSKSVGNDLSTPMLQYGFAGLVPGDRWCLCVTRWKDALQAGAAPPVVLDACHLLALEWVTLDELESHAVQ
ncbi:MAG: DUF2237 domain-containing protein [Acidimicrobiales bacterium]